MKKIIIFFIITLFSLPAFSQSIIDPSINEANKPLEVSITFDWITKNQMQRDENIKQIQSILFEENTTYKIDKKDFKKIYSSYWKNSNYLNDYEDISKGKKEDSEKYYCGFYVGKLLIAYGIQHKKSMKNIYYYDAMGNLRWIDVFSENYPVFPYWSYQYYKNGEMIAAYYYINEYDQYVFDSNKKFRGRWFKENLYNRKAKIVMTRTNY